MILVVDNYDSFVHNVARYFVELGESTRVVRNDSVKPSDLEAAKAIVISPGPCTPQEAGQSPDIMREWSGRKPILGICLGHQVMGEVFGGIVKRARRPMHGDSSEINHDGQASSKACRSASAPGAITRSSSNLRTQTRRSSSRRRATRARSWGSVMSRIRPSGYSSTPNRF